MNVSSVPKKIPNSPGVYLFRDESRKIIYVGKAKNLKNRLSSYFPTLKDDRYLIRQIIHRVTNVECIVTKSEKEALLLENNLIKQHHPRFNILLRDDKMYQSLMLSRKHDFPRIHRFRQRGMIPIAKKDGVVFGPFSSAAKLKETVQFIRKVFKLRGCKDSMFNNRIRPCLDYETGLCSAPCVGNISKEDYGKDIDLAIRFLKGHSGEIKKKLTSKMKAAAAQLRFEDAGRIKRQLHSIELTLEDQHVVINQKIDADVWGICASDKYCAISKFIVRGGTVKDVISSQLPHQRYSEKEILNAFLTQYYLTHAQVSNNELPKEIIVPFLLPNQNLLTSALSENRQTVIVTPTRGNKKKLLHHAHENAKSYHGQKLKETSDYIYDSSIIQTLFELPFRPIQIECFDIANIQGESATGAKIAFTYGKPNKSRYRHFRIRTKDTPDDYQMMYEMLYRRFKSGVTKGDLPDLAVIDGGKGHLNMALEVQRELEVKSVSFISIAKPTPTEPHDKFYIPNKTLPIVLDPKSNEFRMFQFMRDEAHRFSRRYHHKLHQKKMLSSDFSEG